MGLQVSPHACLLSDIMCSLFMFIFYSNLTLCNLCSRLFILSVHCGMVFSCTDKKVVHSLGLLCPIHSVERVKKISVGYMGS